MKLRNRAVTATAFAVATLAALAGSELAAQDLHPSRRPSPLGMSRILLGDTYVKVVYSQPYKRDRENIFGTQESKALVPFGEVWRTGANEATKILFSDAVRIDGREVPAGTYSFFAIPTATSWTLILNKKAAQWGAFSYSAADDQLRFEVKPSVIGEQEWLRYSIEAKTDTSAIVQLAWEKLAVEFTVEVESEKILVARIDEAIAKAKPDDAAVYLSSAKYYYEHGLAPEKAMLWIDKSIAISDGFQARECKARLADRLGRKAEAVAQVEKAIELATAAKARPQFLDALGKLLAEYKAK